MHHLSQITTVVQQHVGTPAIGAENGLVDAPPVVFLRFSLPGEDRNPSRCNGGGGMILGREDIAGRPAHFGAQGHQGLDENGGLDGHVQAAHDTGALQRLLFPVFLAQCHQTGHFRLGDGDFLAAPFRQGNIGDLIVGCDVFDRLCTHECLPCHLSDCYFRPAASRRSSALSVFSQVNSSSSRPKCP